MGNKYPALTFIAKAFRVIAVLIGISGILLTFGLAFGFSSQSSLLPSFMTSLWLPSSMGTGPLDLLALFLFATIGIGVPILFALLVYAIGDLFLCIVDIEANTRQK